MSHFAESVVEDAALAWLESLGYAVLHLPAPPACAGHLTPEDPDRQRRKQAEFLVHESMAWDLVEQIGVLNRAMKKTVEAVLGRHPSPGQLLVQTKPSWYYKVKEART